MSTEQIELGQVTAPSGNLFLVDCGLLPLWCHDRPPLLPDGVLDNDAQTADANNSADLELVGDDALTFGRTLDHPPLPQWLFDIKGSAVDPMVEKVHARARADNANIDVRVVRPQVPHLDRAKLVLAAFGGGGVQFHGIHGVTIGGIPHDRPLQVLAEVHRDTEYAGRWQRVCVPVSNAAIATSVPSGVVMVDEARILVSDLEAIGAWDPESVPDGLADVAFWGRDGQTLAQRENAPAMEEPGTFGWKNLPLAKALPLAERLFELRETSHELKFALDFRPHSVEWELLEQVRRGDTESGVAQFGGAQATMFMTTWGDGVFEVFRDLDAHGNLVQIRIELATDERLDLVRRM